MAHPPGTPGVSATGTLSRLRRISRVRPRAPRRFGARPILLAPLVILLGTWNAQAQLRPQEPGPAVTEPITVVADSVRNWSQGDVRILLLEGNAYIAQGLTSIRAPHAVVWIHEPAEGASPQLVKQIEVYAEGTVRFEGTRHKFEANDLFQTLQTRSALRVDWKKRTAGPAVDDPIFQHAEARRTASSPPDTPVRQAAYQNDPELFPGGMAGGRRLRLFPRSTLSFNSDTYRVSPEETALVFTGGINLIVDNVEGIGTVDILADRMVLWTRSMAEAQRLAQEGAETTQAPGTPLEMYLEGNVVVRQGPRTIEANQMFYDVNRNLALGTNAEVTTVAERLGGPIYFRAERLRQVSANRFIAERTQTTPSRFGIPTYAFETDQITLDDITQPVTNPFSGEPVRDPATGLPVTETRHRVTGVNNFFYVDDIPLFYLPYIETTLEDFDTPIKSATFRQSRTFGTEVLTTWDMFQLLGGERPRTIRRWDLNVDYLSQRGPAVGSSLEYRGSEFFGLDGPNWGLLDTYWIDDQGTDRLGVGRMHVEPEQEARGRLLARHRQILPDDFTLTLELAYTTDINFLEQFFEREWEEDKDQETLIYLKQQRDNWAWSVLARARILDFLTQTEDLPQLDLFLLGEPLLGDRLTYFTHSSAGYLEFLSADRSRGDIFPFPEGPSFAGPRVDTLHEVDYPFGLGPFRVVPFAMGRATAWGDTLTGSEDRLYGAVGARTSLPLWRTFPSVDNDLLNLHGLAHKMVFSLEYFLAQSDLDSERLPLYDELEDDTEQVFRQRFLYRDYAALGRPFPPQLDPREYAIRTGLMTSAEAVDDLQVVRFDLRQRLQTKRGVPGLRHIIDYMTLDTSFAYFPNQSRDNFGEPFGLMTYDYSWHIGDRTSILSSGWFETFDQGPRMFNIGMFLERPPRGSFFVGFTSLEPIGSRVAQVSYNYYMSPKWISSFSTSYDFGETRDLGQSLVLTRIGADLVFRLGLNFDPLTDNYGVAFELQPRLAPDLRFGSVRGPAVPLEFAPVE